METKKLYVAEAMNGARKEKEELIQNILDYQEGHKYSESELKKKNLSRIREIWDKIEKGR